MLEVTQNVFIRSAQRVPGHLQHRPLRARVRPRVAAPVGAGSLQRQRDVRPVQLVAEPPEGRAGNQQAAHQPAQSEHFYLAVFSFIQVFV